MAIIATLVAETFVVVARYSSQSVIFGGVEYRAAHDGGAVRVYGSGPVELSPGWWDLVTIVDGEYDGPPFSGNTPIEDEHVYGWEGVPHESASTRRERWIDWTDGLTTVLSHRGGVQDGLEIRNDVGVLTLTMRGIQLDLAAPQFIPGQVVRLRHVGVQRSDVFTGKIQDIATWYERTHAGRSVPMMRLTVTDAVADHRAVARYGAIPPGGAESFASRITRLAATATAPVELPTGVYAQQLGRTVYESTLANHFTLACNTVGAMWWVDASGITRFQKRRASTTPIYFVNGPNQWGSEWPADALHGLYDDSEGGSRYLFNSAHVRVLGAVPAEDRPTEWVEDVRDEQGAELVGSIAIFGERPVVLVTNDAGPVDPDTFEWLIPFGSGNAIVRSITWNAQEDLSRIPDLDIGTTVILPGRNAAWNYIIIGVHHTITPTRWLVQLTLGAVYAPLI